MSTNVTSIGNQAFSGCDLTGITIPDRVTSIGNNAFSGCSITSIIIPDSVTSIGAGVFSGCNNLVSMQVSANNENYDSRDNCNAIINTNTNELISGCKTTIIPASVVKVGERAFHSLEELTEITIPQAVTSIGEYAFCSSGLTSIIIPEGVIYIGGSAFASCYELASVTIPVSVTTIEEDAFLACDMEMEVIYTGTEEQWNQISISWGNNAITKEPIEDGGA